ncbi:DEAD/DEAH box helicase [Clostridium paraputrificum]|uniref:ATP-dependent RNA helicase DbpA n=2 Tax=Clostridium TaxID=1485 RepID=A0A1B8RQL6_9CLOT|nr:MULTISPECIES: DEAD/DEAH box helicase [Clostridium]MDB2088596.1 DEAD/DEAH box helicase [Clostridium paraputrificum]MDB2096238.1 DEAD/DEAH box helicase [Clostridium paraputrificum]MDU1178511.1 DEAD/DEAH box helicase [Clostridium sp.]MDU1225878.1 DEAD/DEAH box helicase [Clostridium sp.]MDU4318047.1 DEAD/DEAH box helicase [Clostridium sp.]
MINAFEKFKFSKELIKALDALEYKEPTGVQEKVIPEVLFNKDLIVKSQTGTGKTGAFVIPLCERVKWEENDPQVLILSPTRELAIQIGEDVKNIGRYKRLKGVSVYGKAPFKDQAQELKGKTHIVIGTPGRVLDHIDRGTFNTSNIKYLVIDEADEMLNMGFIRQVEGIIRRIPKKRVTMLFSATIPEEIRELCSKHLKRPVNIEVESSGLVVDRIENILFRVNGEEKLKYLRMLLAKEKPETAVIFCRTKENVDVEYDYLKSLGYSVDKIHGGMLQKDRISTMEKFKKGDFRILVATDIAARGIDVEGITHVINIDVPLEKEAYVHRIGRTARAGKSGKAITFVTPYEDRFLNDIEEYIGFKIPEKSLEEIFLDEKLLESEESVLKKKAKKKESKSKNINKEITKLYFNGGKKKKIRAVDFVGTISNIEGVSSDDIGIIEIGDMGSYVEILNGKGKLVLEELKDSTIKGKKLKVEIAKKR